MPNAAPMTAGTLLKDVSAGLVVFFVALPLCLGVALASNAPPISGVIAGVIGGIVVGLLSGSSTSVSGPSPAITAIVAAYIASLGSFPAFLCAVVVAGVLQILLGVCRGGFIAAFFPSSVVKGLLAAVGIILILKQTPHLIGHDTDAEGEMSFLQTDGENTFSELWAQFNSWHYGAAAIGIASVIVLVAFERIDALKKLKIPTPLIVVVMGVVLQQVFQNWGEGWAIAGNHLVQVPVAESLWGFADLLHKPDFSFFANPQVYTAGLVIAIVASLESLLNVEALNNIDPLKRPSPTNRELIAQGVGNVTSGLLGGIPMSSVIVRSSVNINAGAKPKSPPSCMASCC
ncbi:MAG: SulP family inorganic anion transporter [Pirellulales bacterium]